MLVLFDGKGGCERLLDSKHQPRSLRVSLRHLLFYGARPNEFVLHPRLALLTHWREFYARLSEQDRDAYEPSKLGFFPPDVLEYVVTLKRAYADRQMFSGADGRPDFEAFMAYVEANHATQVVEARLRRKYAGNAAALAAFEKMRAAPEWHTSATLSKAITQYWDDDLDRRIPLKNRTHFAKLLLVDSLFNFEDPANMEMQDIMEGMLHKAAREGAQDVTAGAVPPVGV
jgi:hypothetical protein